MHKSWHVDEDFDLFVIIPAQSLIKFTNSNESNQWEHDSFTKFPIENATYEFEQILKEDPTYILMQNIKILNK